MSLEAKQFYVSSVPLEDGMNVEIIAHESGHFAWFFLY
jgi:hypothetical protein